MKKNDIYGNEIEVGDWIAFSARNTLKSGVVASFTKGGSPRVHEYNENWREHERSNHLPFCPYPTAAGLNSGFIKINPLTDEEPLI